jgi:hypothetical protein
MVNDSAGRGRRVTLTKTNVALEARVDGLHPGLSIEREGFAAIFSSDMEMGDPVFDRRVWVTGDRLALGLLSDPARRALLECPYNYTLSGGRLTLIDSNNIATRLLIEDLARHTVEVAEHFSLDGPEVLERMGQGVIQDPEAGVRRTFLRLLAGADPQRAAAVATIRRRGSGR